MTKRRYLLLALLPLLWGCGDRLAEVMHHQEAQGGNVKVQIGMGGVDVPSRTVAPAHVSLSDMEDPSRYRLTMRGTSDMGGQIDQNFTIRNGLGVLLLDPGAWDLVLTVRDVVGSADILQGDAFVIVQNAPTTVSITLTPLTSTTGTVNVQFTLPQSVVKRLDPQGNTSKTVTVALYDQQDQVVTATQRTFNVATGTTAQSFTYTQNSVPSGKYTLRLTATYTVNNASTGNSDKNYTLGWQDVLYVEGNRLSSASVTLPEGATGAPGNPYLRDKYNLNGGSAAGAVNHDGSNFLNATSFNPWKETLWLYGYNWDTSGNDTNGNEILVVSWNPVYDADYYELEILIHPFVRNVRPPASWGKFDRVVTDDVAWETLKARTFTYSGQTRQPSYMRYSGGAGDPDNYRSKTWVIKCNVNDNFLSCADKNLARTLFPGRGAAAGKVNSSYTLATTRDAFDTYSDWMYNNTNLGKVGLEAGCSVVGVLIPAFSPRMSLVYRVRAVNEFGHSDWVYWKGGKW